MRYFLRGLLIVLSCAMFLFFTSPASAAKTSNWAMFGYNSWHNHFNPDETTLSPTNDSHLGLDWKYTTNAPVDLSSPAVVDGVVYVGSGDTNVYAFHLVS